MNMVQIVFSPTGGTQRVVDALTGGWEYPVRRVDLTDGKWEAAGIELAREDLAVIAVPSYGGRAPELAMERLRKVRGNGARCVVVCVYGNRAYEDTLLELADGVEKQGFRVMAAVAGVAEHSIIHQYGAGRPDQQDREELGAFGKRILEKMAGGRAETPATPGDRPYKKAGSVGLAPRADKGCTGCGLCAENCPAQAIRRDKLRQTDRGKCISCMRCVTQCPQSARRANGIMISLAALVIKKACSERKGNELYL